MFSKHKIDIFFIIIIMKSFYFLGIGGVSMSALAIFLKQKGLFVSGSDISHGVATEMLEQNGIKVDFDINEEAIKSADVICVSSAIKQEDKRLKIAKEQKKKIITRGELLGEISKDYEKVIAIAGSHGKTTTTALIFHILKTANKNPTLHLGGYKIDDNKNYFVGGNEFFITEACEYCDNFLYLNPYLSIITNIEPEHLDYFKNFENQKKSFEKFELQSESLIKENLSFHAENVFHDKDGFLSFDLFKEENLILHFDTKLLEEINTKNIICAYRACRFLGVSDRQIEKGVESFSGVKCRFEKMKSERFGNVICDYAHHPTEIKNSIKSAKKIFLNKNLFVIFQPHTFSRTKFLFDEFFDVFKDVENPIFFKTYSAREKETDGMSAREFAEILRKTNKNTRYFEDFSSLNNFLQQIRDKQDCVLLFVGAGDLPQILNQNGFVS